MRLPGISFVAPSLEKGLRLGWFVGLLVEAKVVVVARGADIPARNPPLQPHCLSNKSR